MLPLAVLAMAFHCCWVASHAAEQRWGSTETGRYKTDFNGLALQQIGDVSRNNDEMLHDRVFGMIRFSAAFEYDALRDLDGPGEKAQYKFWRSIFGHGRLLFFDVADKFAFPNDRT